MPARPHHFCTIVDEGYLLRLLALHRSLAAVTRDPRLHVACVDFRTKAILDQLQLPGLRAFDLRDLEEWDPELLLTKSTRSLAEYCFTAKASLCLYLLAHQWEIDPITYLDADLVFLHDPKPLFEELGDESVLIVPHRRDHAPEWTRLYGTYNAGTLAFRRDERALGVLRWWRARCIEWCFDIPENGKYTDQRYLNDWPERFDGVHVLQHLGGGLAPWNGSQYSFEDRGGTLLVEGVPAIFYHFQSLKLYRGITTLRRLGLMARTYRFTPRPVPLVWSYRELYPVSSEEDRLFWQPYARRLSEGLLELRRVDPGFDAGFVDERAAARRELERRVRRRAKRVRRASRPTVRRVRRSWRQAAKGVRKRVRSARRGFLRAGGRVLRVFDR